MKTTLRIMALGAALAVLPVAAMAQSNVGGIFQDITNQLRNIPALLGIVSFVLGVALAIAGLMKFYAASKNPNDPSAKMSTAFILIFVGATLVALPILLGVGITTIFGSGGTSLGVDGGGLQSIR
jgi:hypothetical protein